MFVRICLLSALTIGALAAPAFSSNSVPATGTEVRDGQTMLAWFTPSKPSKSPSPCRTYGRC